MECGGGRYCLGRPYEPPAMRTWSAVDEAWRGIGHQVSADKLQMSPRRAQRSPDELQMSPEGLGGEALYHIILRVGVASGKLHPDRPPGRRYVKRF